METLGSTSAINSDKTGTLTLNQMTAVEMATVGRRYEISGTGYGISGKIMREGGDLDDENLEEFLLPMVLASDAVARNGELIGDPTEGALVVLAGKGGVGTEVTRERYPRLATLPFDAAYKLMATFHRWTDAKGKEFVRAYIKGAPDQLLDRAVEVYARDHDPVDGRRRRRASAYMAENDRLASRGLRVLATARKDLPTSGLRRRRRPARADRGPDPDGPGRHRGPATPDREGLHRDRPPRRHPGAHDHR